MAGSEKEKKKNSTEEMEEGRRKKKTSKSQNTSYSICKTMNDFVHMYPRWRNEFPRVVCFTKL